MNRNDKNNSELTASMKVFTLTILILSLLISNLYALAPTNTKVSQLVEETNFKKAILSRYDHGSSVIYEFDLKTFANVMFGYYNLLDDFLPKNYKTTIFLTLTDQAVLVAELYKKARAGKTHEAWADFQNEIKRLDNNISLANQYIQTINTSHSLHKLEDWSEIEEYLLVVRDAMNAIKRSIDNISELGTQPNLFFQKQTDLPSFLDTLFISPSIVLVPRALRGNSFGKAQVSFQVSPQRTISTEEMLPPETFQFLKDYQIRNDNMSLIQAIHNFIRNAAEHAEKYHNEAKVRADTYFDVQIRLQEATSVKPPQLIIRIQNPSLPVPKGFFDYNPETERLKIFDLGVSTRKGKIGGLGTYEGYKVITGFGHEITMGQDVFSEDAAIVTTQIKLNLEAPQVKRSNGPIRQSQATRHSA